MWQCAHKQTKTNECVAKTNECKCNMKIKHCNVRHFSFHLLLARLSVFLLLSILHFLLCLSRIFSYFPLKQCLSSVFDTFNTRRRLRSVYKHYILYCYYYRQFNAARIFYWKRSGTLKTSVHTEDDSRLQLRHENAIKCEAIQSQNFLKLYFKSATRIHNLILASLIVTSHLLLSAWKSLLLNSFVKSWVN